MIVLMEVGEDGSGVMRPFPREGEEDVDVREWASAMIRRPGAYWGRDAGGWPLDGLLEELSPGERESLLEDWPEARVVFAVGIRGEPAFWALVVVPDGTTRSAPDGLNPAIVMTEGLP